MNTKVVQWSVNPQPLSGVEGTGFIMVTTSNDTEVADTNTHVSKVTVSQFSYESALIWLMLFGVAPSEAGERVDKLMAEFIPRITELVDQGKKMKEIKELLSGRKNELVEHFSESLGQHLLKGTRFTSAYTNLITGTLLLMLLESNIDHDMFKYMVENASMAHEQMLYPFDYYGKSYEELRDMLPQATGLKGEKEALA